MDQEENCNLYKNVKDKFKFYFCQRFNWVTRKF